MRDMVPVTRGLQGSAGANYETGRTGRSAGGTHELAGKLHPRVLSPATSPQPALSPHCSNTPRCTSALSQPTAPAQTTMPNAQNYPQNPLLAGIPGTGIQTPGGSNILVPATPQHPAAAFTVAQVTDSHQPVITVFRRPGRGIENALPADQRPLTPPPATQPPPLRTPVASLIPNVVEGTRSVRAGGGAMVGSIALAEIRELQVRSTKFAAQRACSLTYGT